MRVVWAPVALNRAEEAARYIARDRPGGVARWAEGIFELVSKLRTLPQRGRVVREVARPEIREILCGEHRVIYRLEERRVVILTVRHQRMNLTVAIGRVGCEHAKINDSREIGAASEGSPQLDPQER